MFRKDTLKRGGIGLKLKEVAFNFYGKDLRERIEHQVRGALHNFVMGKGFYIGKNIK